LFPFLSKRFWPVFPSFLTFLPVQPSPNLSFFSFLSVYVSTLILKMPVKAPSPFGFTQAIMIHLLPSGSLPFFFPPDGYYSY